MFSIFNIFFGLIMVAALVGMILCAKKQHVNPKAKPASIGLLVLVIICAISIMVHNMGGEDNSGLVANEAVYARSAAYTLGKTLAELSPGAKVLYIVARLNGNSGNGIQQKMIESFKEGCGSTITEIKIVTPYKTEPLNNMPMMEMFTAKKFNKLLSANKEYNLIVTTIGLPHDPENMTIWKTFEKTPEICPKFAFLNSSPPKLASLIESNFIKAIVTFKPKADYEKAASSDIQEAFNTRYLLITKGNLKQIEQKYPSIFKNK